MRLKIIGNGTHDIVNGVSRPGGIYTIAKYITVPSWGLYPTYTSEISIETTRASREVEWNSHHWLLSYDLPSSFWAHISYLDAISFDVRKANAHFVSADLCGDRVMSLKELGESLRGIDLLIVKEEEYRRVQAYVPGHCAVITREHDFINYYWRAKSHAVIRWSNRWIDVDDSVGAGDAFVAGFLNQVCGDQLSYPDVTKEVIDAAINTAIQHLRSQNGEI